MLHLCNGVVGGVGGLHALVPADADSHVSRLDHAHIVGAVAYSQSNGFDVLLHHVYNFGLLQWRHSEWGQGKEGVNKDMDKFRKK